MSDNRHKVELEWVLPNLESLRSSLPAMLRFRKMNLEALGWAMAKNGLSRNIIGPFMNGRQQNIRCDSMFDAMEALDLEIVVRRRSGKGVRARAAALRAERGLPPVEDVQQAAVMALVPEDARDENGHLKRPLTEAERADAHALLDRYGSFK